MTDDLSRLIPAGRHAPDRPLQGLTVLAVEDSRFASEAIRLLCLQSGARIRRADCLRSARRHLKVYRPSAVIVDLGLPDGAGENLITELAALTPRRNVILATSGDDGAGARALAAGADGFLPKPIAGLALFQQAIIEHLPDSDRPGALPSSSAPDVAPDPLAYRDDMVHAAALLADGADAETLDYLTQFLSGVARAACDLPLEQAAEGLAARRRQGVAAEDALWRLSGLVDARTGAGSL